MPAAQRGCTEGQIHTTNHPGRGPESQEEASEEGQCAKDRGRPHTKKRADQPAQHNKNTPHKREHTTHMPKHPRTHCAETGHTTECPVPDAPQHGTGLLPQQAPPRQPSRSQNARLPKKTKNGGPAHRKTSQKSYSPHRKEAAGTR
ncbi:hypothetical protein CRENBAI_013656 [Crenichthys baileyi]|uniref:Uncharacterized protein n=1 Tax=Crenichthys baileyi TaxID=28760 RepID=A0AAV9RJT5_9TELE